LILVVVPLLSALISILAVDHVAFLTLAERTIEDIRTATILPPEEQDARVVIVAITEDTLKLFPYRSPVDREFLATLLKTLEQRQPAAIGVDILFDQETEPDKDALLHETLGQLTVPLAVSYSDSPMFVDEAQLEYLDKFVPPHLRVRCELGTDPTDGVVRSIVPGVRNKDGSITPGFARGLAQRVGIETPAIPVETVWHGRPDLDTPAFKTFPAHLVPILPADWFTDKIVLIGEVVSLTDRHRTPFSVVYEGTQGEFSGIEINAHAVSQLINHRHSRRLGWAGDIVLVTVLAALGTLFGCVNTSLVRHLGLSLVTLAVLWPAGFAVLYFTGAMAPLVKPTIGFLIALWGTDAFTGREARRQREFINGAFARYLNPQLVKQLSNDPDRLKLGGETRDLTLLFCDVRGFTTISELFDAQGLTRLINRFLTPMTDVILQRKGTIDKYMGDCIMAFWNAPLDDPEHAANACRSALTMSAELAPLNAQLEAEAATEKRRHVPINIGIGLNSGDVVVGNMGSDQRFDYSVLGDNVNLASRLEGQSKTYGVTIVIGENTFVRAPGFACLELDLIKVKGKTEAVRIYTLVGPPEDAETPAFRALAEEHGKMLSAYRSQDWAAAKVQIELCSELGKAYHLDKLYHLYEERIAEYQRTPPGSDWDGVYVALTK
jgi:class 3 adenylate cyclase/CHASE2 domain-containing sensor protein